MLGRFSFLSAAPPMSIWSHFGFPWVLENAPFRDDLGPTATQNLRSMGPLSAFLKSDNQQNRPILRNWRLFSSPGKPFP